MNRNFWRRKFYDLFLPTLIKSHIDIVLVPKKGVILDYKDQLQVAEFEKNITFLSKVVLKNL